MTVPAILSIAEAPAYLEAAGLARRGTIRELEMLSGGISSVVILAVTPERRMIIKQALPKLRVQADWPSPTSRSMVEVAAIQTLAPLLPSGAVPELLHVDTERHCFVMTAAPADAVNWKTELLAGHVDIGVAAQVGSLLATAHLATAADPTVAERFDDRSFFDSLRVDPYYWTICAVYPEIRPVIEAAVTDMLAHRQALVHGDFSPKNMLRYNHTLLLLDYEVAHWGDPAFDLAFCLNHFLLKAVYRSPDSAPYYALARTFWDAYTPALAIEAAATLLPRTLLLQAGMMLARIDGKSPAEYITNEAMKNRVRRISRRLLAMPPHTLDETIAVVDDERTK